MTMSNLALQIAYPVNGYRNSTMRAAIGITEMNSIEEILAECKKLEHEGFLQQAIDILASAIPQTQDPRLYFRRGHIQQKIGEYRQSLSNYSVAIILSPANAEYYLSRANLYANCLDDTASAIEDYLVAATLVPDWSYPHQELSMVYLAIGEKSQAVTHAVVSATKEPHNSSAHFCLGVCRLAVGEYYLAIEALRAAILLEPTYEAYWSSLGRALAEVQNLDEAKTCYIKAIELKPSARTWFNLGNLYYEMELIALAIECLNSAENYDVSVIDRLMIDSCRTMINSRNKAATQIA